MKKNKYFTVIALAFMFLFAGTTFAQEQTDFSLTENAAMTELKAEIALRDSVMSFQDSSCLADKNALRDSLQIEQAKCANWEQSYNTLKKDNEVCAKALGVYIDSNEKNKEKAEENRKNAAMMSSTSFLGGLALGALIMWLIID